MRRTQNNAALQAESFSIHWRRSGLAARCLALIQSDGAPGEARRVEITCGANTLANEYRSKPISARLGTFDIIFGRRRCAAGERLFGCLLYTSRCV